MLAALIALPLLVSAQNEHTIDSNGRFEWGWQLPIGDNPDTSGQYYVKIPQAEQRVSYSADGTGYHGAFAVNNVGDQHRFTSSFALGQQAIKLLSEQGGLQAPGVLVPQDINPEAQDRSDNTLQLFLIQQQFATDPYQQHFGLINVPSYYYSDNNAPTVQTKVEKNKTEDVTPKSLKKEIKKESNNNSVVTVFKDANCTHESTSNIVWGDKKTKFAPRERPIKDEMRNNARSERIMFALSPNILKKYSEQEGISRLVASTQDLISNDDLLKINHAAEKNFYHNDDLIKAASKKTEQTTKQNYVMPNQQRFTVKTKINNVVRPTEQYIPDHTERYQLHHTEKYMTMDEIEESESKRHSFSTPIVVKDSTLSDLRDQMVNNIVSTVAPYIDDGYEVASIKNNLGHTLESTLDKFVALQESRETEDANDSQYLAPITVGLRLLNSNDTEVLNDLDDAQTSDSEVVPKIKAPVKEKTIVEIQESIPIETIHINNIEVHSHYLNEDNNNNNKENLYRNYLQALESSKKIQETMNKQLYEHGTMLNKDYSKDTLNSESNLNSQYIEPDEEEESNERKDFFKYKQKLFGHKIIQPIVIEKQVPVTKYVDRVVEKKVPYPQRVEVVKEVEKPVVVPVPYETIVEKPYEVTRYVDKPYPVQVPHPYPVEINVPYPIEHKVYVDRPVHYPYPVEKVVEKQYYHQVPVPTPVAVPVEVPVEKQVLYPVPIDKPYPVAVEVEKHIPVETIVEKPVAVPYPVEKHVPVPVPYETKVPVPYPVEKKVPYPVDRIVEKPYPVTQIVEKEVRVEVPVPHPVAVRYPQPYPVDRIVEKKVPYPVPVDRVVEKEVPVKVPYPVEKVVEKIVEKPVLVTKYVDKPYPVETKVPYPVDRIVEKKVPYPVEVPVEIKVPYPVDRIINRPYPVKVPYPVEKYVPVFYSGSQNMQNKNNHEDKNYSQPPHFKNKQISKNPPVKSIPKKPSNHHHNQVQNHVQTTQWGNLYASSYQYLNATPKIKEEFKKSPQLSKYLNYLTEHKNEYYGPPPVNNYDDSWNRNSRGSRGISTNQRRTDRYPKMSKLRIEYGFKPPLVPSMEVDLDGLPVGKARK